jgi:hypothetical protein
MATGIIGLDQYLSQFLPSLNFWPMHLIGVGATEAIVLLLYRRIASQGTPSAAWCWADGVLVGPFEQAVHLPVGLWYSSI